MSAVLSLRDSGDSAFFVHPSYKKRLPSSSVHPQIARIAASLAREGVIVTRFMHRAGVSYVTWRGLATGRHQPSRATLAKLDAALIRLSQPQIVAAGVEDPLAVIFRLACTILAREHGLAPEDVLDMERDRQRPMDPDWLKKAQVRSLAVYLTHIQWGTSLSVTGRACGLCKQAVAKALRAVEARRDNPHLDALLDRVAGYIRVV